MNDNYNHLTKQDGTRYNSTLAGKNIRADLRKAFPGFKGFSVKKRSGSYTNAITISWTDGPNCKEVEAIVGKYQHGDFNGMEDNYDMKVTGFHDCYGSSDYVFCQRSLSVELKMEVGKRLNLPVMIDEHGCLNFSLCNRGEQDLYRHELNSISVKA